MKRKFIPIIGTISAGKSTFLKAFLGINMLQIGATTTTKFVCLIKNSTDTCFYHVIPKIEESINFYKDGEETKGEEEIKKRIENINEQLTNSKITKDDLFYMLEVPIKNINNRPLLDSCYFMDIPGLNENSTTYIDDIFSLITMNDILFEIMVFDSTSIGSDNILNIFKKLKDKNCLKKDNNLYILNKIDHCTKGGEGDIIDSFKNYFYKEFEDEKNKERIIINFSENHFIPMNSLLYQAETKINEDFYSLLLFELFTFLEYKEFSNFFEYIQKRIESIINHNNLDIDKIETKIKNIKENSDESEIIIKSVENLKKIIQFIKTSSEFEFGIKLEKNKVKKELKKLFVIHKEKIYMCIHSDSYNKLQDIIDKIIIESEDLSTPPGIFDIKNKIDKKNKSNSNNINLVNLNEINNEIIENNKKDIKYNLSIIQDLDDFINNTFKLLNANNELGDFKGSLAILRENILGRKIRISFIGNISVGKSTVLNCIIGEKILPTKESECTYRGVIIRHKNINSFELYRTKLISKGIGYDKYYYFQDEEQFYCKGIQNIKSYLNNKNNDKNIDDEDAYIVIVGKLKIFDFIKLDESLIRKIEFIDLPGPDRKNNTFNDKKYYQKILRFSNSCVYINEPKTINDEINVNRMREQYLSDKSKVCLNLRQNFIQSCLFLINKSDTIEKSDRQKIIDLLIKNIPENNINKDKLKISFFSGKLFGEYLEYYYKYVYLLENKPLYLLKILYQEWSSNILYLRTFKHFIINKISDKIEEKFDLDLDKEIEISDLFYNEMKANFNILYKYNFRGISDKDEDEIIKKLFIIKTELKNKNFDQTNYSASFFNKIKDILDLPNNQLPNFELIFIFYREKRKINS